MATTSSKREPATEDQLRDGVRHIEYEIIRAVWQSLEAVGIPSAVPERTPIHDAAVEAALTHLRCLDDFFHLDVPGPRERNRIDDIVAKHYALQWRSVSIFSEAEREDVNGLLSHLTARRQPAREWKLEPLARKAGDLYLTFVEQVEPRWRPLFSESVLEDVRYLLDRGVPLERRMWPVLPRSSARSISTGSTAVTLTTADERYP